MPLVPGLLRCLWREVHPPAAAGEVACVPALPYCLRLARAVRGAVTHRVGRASEKRLCFQVRQPERLGCMTS